MPGTLFVVATPIGNLDDITLRAISTLKAVALIAAEDTRRTGILLRRFGIRTPTTSLHEHNEREKLPKLVEKLVEGADIALVSDAGTPLVADPGRRLVSAAVARGVHVSAVPGPSAILAALTMTGFPSDTFVFAGFAPAKAKDRKKWLSSLALDNRTIVFFEAPHRIQRTLEEVTTFLVNRPIFVGRELTKMHEESIRFTGGDAGTPPAVADRGELTIVIGPGSGAREGEVVDPTDVVRYFGQLTAEKPLGRREAAAETAHKFGLSTNDVYALVEQAKRQSSP